MNRRTTELDVSKLDGPSRRVLAAFVDHPAASRANMLMEQRADGSWSLLVTLPSPTGERRRQVAIWLDENRVPSLELGGWHSHADLWNADPEVGLRRMLDYLKRIIGGEVVLAELPTLAEGMPYRVLDLMDRHEILDELTAPTIPSDMKLLSWSGSEDAILNDLREGPT